MELLVDNIRKPDEDNPKGYYELEVVKKIREDASWLEGSHGKVFKMVSMLLYDLPGDKKYRVIFMRRTSTRCWRPSGRCWRETASPSKITITEK